MNAAPKEQSQEMTGVRVNRRRKKEHRLVTGVALHPCITILLEPGIHRITRLPACRLVTWGECHRMAVNTVAIGVVTMDRRVTCTQATALRLIICRPEQGLLLIDKDGIIIGTLHRRLRVMEGEMALKRKNLRKNI